MQSVAHHRLLYTVNTKCSVTFPQLSLLTQQEILCEVDFIMLLHYSLYKVICFTSNAWFVGLSCYYSTLEQRLYLVNFRIFAIRRLFQNK